MKTREALFFEARKLVGTICQRLTALEGTQETRAVLAMRLMALETALQLKLDLEAYKVKPMQNLGQSGKLQQAYHLVSHALLDAQSGKGVNENSLYKALCILEEFV